ncbi:MAG: hypothetical protein COV67_08430 [Nitrospinae bacterium CG11_big_fil_rev_8_21_14_0_20_56_8]|nr:MAG: hypothetical protein COV67_08430 [Nitrospinae bacterium CG11_big_fil_rev_8_21_14_0_20_56_8]
MNARIKLECFLFVIIVAGFIAGSWIKPVSTFAGEMQDVPKYEIVDDTVIVKGGDETKRMVNWIFVKCDYWAGCFMRCEGNLKDCRKVSKLIEEKIRLEISEEKHNHENFAGKKSQ